MFTVDINLIQFKSIFFQIIEHKMENVYVGEI